LFSCAVTDATAHGYYYFSASILLSPLLLPLFPFHLLLLLLLLLPLFRRSTKVPHLIHNFLLEEVEGLI